MELSRNILTITRRKEKNYKFSYIFYWVKNYLCAPEFLFNLCWAFLSLADCKHICPGGYNAGIIDITRMVSLIGAS